MVGVLILLFIPYLLWGTGLATARDQAVLRSDFAGQAERTQGLRPLRPGPSALVLAPSAPIPPIGAPIGVISIPAIGLSMVVVQGTGTDQLRMGPGHYPSTPLPGQAGNAAIAGHRTTYLHPFGALDRLQPGDPITVATAQGLFRYSVTGSQVVDPTDVAVVGPTPVPTLTLTTCNPRYSARTRLVVHAVLTATALVGASTPPPPKGASDRPTVVRSTATNNWAFVALWGALVTILTVAGWRAVGRTRGWVRAGVITGGTVGWVVAVFGLFSTLAPLLPASF